jgi:hypothetical protein
MEHDVCRGADFRTRGIGVKRLETGRDGVRFCFKAPGLAKAFQACFGVAGSPPATRQLACCKRDWSQFREHEMLKLER